MPVVHYVLFTLDVIPWEAALEGRCTVSHNRIVAEFLYDVKANHQEAFVDVSALDMVCYKNFETYINRHRRRGNPVYFDNDSPISGMGSSVSNPVVVVSPTRCDRLINSNVISPHTMLAQLANQASVLYTFDFDKLVGPTIEDFLYAAEGEQGEDWDFRVAHKDHYRREDSNEYRLFHKGEQFTSEPMGVLCSPKTRESVRGVRLAGLMGE